MTITIPTTISMTMSIRLRITIRITITIIKTTSIWTNKAETRGMHTFAGIPGI